MTIEIGHFPALQHRAAFQLAIHDPSSNSTSHHLPTYLLSIPTPTHFQRHCPWMRSRNASGKALAGGHEPLHRDWRAEHGPFWLWEKQWWPKTVAKEQRIALLGNYSCNKLAKFYKASYTTALWRSIEQISILWMVYMIMHYYMIYHNIVYVFNMYIYMYIYVNIPVD